MWGIVKFIRQVLCRPTSNASGLCTGEIGIHIQPRGYIGTVRSGEQLVEKKDSPTEFEDKVTGLVASPQDEGGF